MLTAQNTVASSRDQKGSCRRGELNRAANCQPKTGGLKKLQDCPEKIQGQEGRKEGEPKKRDKNKNPVCSNEGR